MQGATFSETLTVFARDGTKADLTGAALVWMASARVDDAEEDVVLTATTAAGTIVITDAANGEIRFAIPASTMAAVAPRTVRERRWYAWTLQVFSGGDTTRYPDDREGGPGLLFVGRSVIGAVPA